MNMWTRLNCPWLDPIAIFGTENVGCSNSVTENASMSLQALIISSKVLCLLELVVGSEHYWLLNTNVL